MRIREHLNENITASVLTPRSWSLLNQDFLAIVEQLCRDATPLPLLLIYEQTLSYTPLVPTYPLRLEAVRLTLRILQPLNDRILLLIDYIRDPRRVEADEVDLFKGEDDGVAVRLDETAALESMGDDGERAGPSRGAAPELYHAEEDVLVAVQGALLALDARVEWDRRQGM